MKVIAFLLSLSHLFARVSKDPLRKDASHQLTFPLLEEEEEHVSRNFFRVSWRGFSILMERSVQMLPQIASWLLGRFAYYSRRFFFPALVQGRSLLRKLIWTLSVGLRSMPVIIANLTVFAVCLLLFLAVCLQEPPLGTLTMSCFPDMVLEPPVRASEETKSICFLLGPYGWKRRCHFQNLDAQASQILDLASTTARFLCPHPGMRIPFAWSSFPRHSSLHEL